MNYEFVLKRINVPETIVLDKLEHSYTCGRGKENEIVCHSLTVSRNHCMFFRGKDSLYVTDLKSCNGVYVNGVSQAPYQMVKLAQHDVIGIGCSGVEANDNSTFAYKLCVNRTQVANEVRDTSEVSNRTSNIDESPPQTSPKRNEGKEDPLRKRKMESRQSDTIVPEKIPKLTVEVTPNQSSRDDNTTSKEVENGLSEDCTNKLKNDFEIIHISLNKDTSTPPLNDSPKSSSNNRNSKPPTKPDTKNPLIRTKQLKATKDQKNERTSENLLDKLEVKNLSYNGMSLSSKGNTSTPLNNTEKSKKTRLIETGVKNIELNNTKDSLMGSKDSSSVNLINNGETLIKLEEELQITDNEEEMSFVYPTVTPIKLKPIKQERTTSFSEIDVVNLSDDEEDIFPCSQLFNVSSGMDASIKQEIKAEPVDVENDQFNRPDEADDVISLTDSEDDDDNLWLQRLSRSQIFNENDDNPDVIIPKIKLEDPEMKNDQTIMLPSKVSKISETGTRDELEIKEQEETTETLNLTEKDIPDLQLPVRRLKLQSKENITMNLKETTTPNTSTEDTASSRRSLKKVPEIEPPHLPTQRRRSAMKTKEISPKKKDRAQNTKELQEKNKLEQHLYKKEQKYRKTLYKWADCLPAGKKKDVILSKEEKKALTNDRKARLKELAVKKRASIEENTDVLQKRSIVKPRAKVSLKTRGDFLADISVSSLNESKVQDESTRKILPKIQRIKKSTDISTEIVGKISADLEESLKLTDRPPKPQSTIQILKSGLKSVGSKKKDTKKRVSFCENIKTIREYEIEPDHVMKKFIGKDAPIPVEKLPMKRANRTDSCPKLEEYLLRIFSWNPVWLEEQRHLNTTAPVVREDELHPMLTHYQSYNEYYKIALPLLLLETWAGITKEFETIERNSRRPTIMCSIVENSIVRHNIPSTNLHLTNLMLEVLVTKEDLHKQMHPIYGDLVFFEYIKSQEGKQIFRKVFAYVTNMHQTVLTHFTHFNKDLANYVKQPYALLTYTVQTRPLEDNILTNRVQRLRSVTYLRVNMRMVQALQYLPQSPVMSLILNPRVDLYQLPMSTDSQRLVTADKLNTKQLEAVIRVTDAVVQKEAKLCFVQGPPGTGKSRVIVNIVTQILYGDNRYKNNGGSLRILVCAPSNAAIDEIVLRLLHIRSTLKDNRFRMVRFGKPETMHPLVRDISATELAKRDVKRTASSYCSNTISVDSVEEEKLFLEARMNALKCEIANSQRVDETYKKYVKMKLADLAARYDLITKRTPITQINPKELSKLQRAAENKLLMCADVITCTLSSCYTSQMESIFGGNRERISVCIVDEATQSCEAETLIPLMLGVNTLVLVGDPNQLPATILSQQAKRLGLDQSIFARVQNAFDGLSNNPIIMLDTQYRMACPIAYFPNKFFYGGRLKNAAETVNNFPFQSYRVLNLSVNQNDDKFSNSEEAEFVATMISYMMTQANLEKWKQMITIGVLTPYNNQRSLVSTKIDEKMTALPEGLRKKVKIDVNTVDGFQGQERDVIIMSCVRSQGIGFLSDKQRLCVALTRAKHTLILCGNFNTFMRDQMWFALISDAKTRRVFYNVNTKAQQSEIKKYIIKQGETK